MAGSGARLTLSAIGAQEKYINGKSDSLWTYKNRQHTNFTLFYGYYKEMNTENPSWPFGETINFDINPKTSGHALANCFLKLTLNPLQANEYYCSQIGKAIIKEYSIRIGDTVIQTIPGDWSVVHDELYADESEKFAKRTLINGGEPDDGTLPDSTSEIPLYIPLDLFFSRYKNDLPKNWETQEENIFKPYLLLCACTQQIVTISVTFNPIPFFTNALNVSVKDSKILLVTEEATLSSEEVEFYRQNKQRCIYNTVMKHPITNVDFTDTFKSQLITNIPVKCFHWFLREQKYQDTTSNTYYRDRYNYSTLPNCTPQQENDNPIIKDTLVRLNGDIKSNIKSNNSIYYKYLQSQLYKFSTPSRNIYTFSFSLNPRDPNPTGSLNFSSVESSKSFIDCSMVSGTKTNTYYANIFFLGYIILSYENDFCKLLFF